jgi:uncharacterized protein (DUF433 family)
MINMVKTKLVVHSDPEIQGGVPVKTLFDHLEAGDSLYIFLKDCPSVSKEQAIAALEIAQELLLEHSLR